MGSRRTSVLALVLGMLALGLPGIATAAVPPAPTPPPLPVGPAIVVTHGPRTAKVIALTFDDGHGNAECAALVDILVATQTPATFFPSARWAAEGPALWHEIAALGFPVGNHTATHPHMTGLSYAEQLAEINSNRTVMEAATGVPMAPLFRPPYGEYNAATIRAATAAGDRYVVLWDTTFADSSKRPNGKPYLLDAYVRAAEKGTNGSIILGHCGDPVDPLVVAQVVADYRAKGYAFVTIPQLLGMPGASPMAFASPGPSAGGPVPASPSAPPPSATPSPTPAVGSARPEPSPAPTSTAPPLPAPDQGGGVALVVLLALGAAAAVVAIAIAMAVRRGRRPG